MLQTDVPDTFVLATNETTTVRDFVKFAFKAADMSIEFKGEGLNEIGVDAETGKELVKINPKFFRPAEVDLLIGNPEKSKNKLGWIPKVKVHELCEMMVKADMKRVQTGNTVF